MLKKTKDNSTCVKNSQEKKYGGFFIMISFFLFFATAIMGRLSAFVDYFFTSWSFEISDRLINKLIWAFFYAIFIFIILIIDLKRYSREIDLSNLSKKTGDIGREKISFINRSRLIITKLWESKLAFYQENKMLIWASLAIIISALISAIFAFNKAESWWGVPYYALLVSIPLMIKYIWGKRLSVNLMIFQNIVLIALALVALYQSVIYDSLATEIHPIISFFDSYGGFMPLSFFLIWDDLIYLRPSSLMADPNFLAIFSVMALSYNMSFAGRIKFIKNRLLRILSTAILCSSILAVGYIVIISASRTAVLMLMVAVFAFIIVKVVRYILSRISLSAKKPSKLHSNVLWIYLYNTYLRIKDGLLLKDTSSLQRIGYADVSLQAFKENPVVGIGIGSFGDYYREFFDNSAGVATPHNAFLRTVAEMGLIGFASFIFYFFAFVKVLINNRKYVYIATIIGIAAGSIFYDFIMTPWMWIYFGIIYADATNKKTE